jgi:hypothetical protein
MNNKRHVTSNAQQFFCSRQNIPRDVASAKIQTQPRRCPLLSTTTNTSQSITVEGKEGSSPFSHVTSRMLFFFSQTDMDAAARHAAAATHTLCGDGHTDDELTPQRQ